MANWVQNALLAATAEHRLRRYVEGCYWTGEGYEKAHAWCENREGMVVELTLPRTSEEIAISTVKDTGPPTTPSEHRAYWDEVFRCRVGQRARRSAQHADASRHPIETRSIRGPTCTTFLYLRCRYHER